MGLSWRGEPSGKLVKIKKKIINENNIQKNKNRTFFVNSSGVVFRKGQRNIVDDPEHPAVVQMLVFHSVKIPNESSEDFSKSDEK